MNTKLQRMRQDRNKLQNYQMFLIVRNSCTYNSQNFEVMNRQKIYLQIWEHEFQKNYRSLNITHHVGKKC